MIFGASALAATQASADYRPGYAKTDHDRRSHSADYYDSYDRDHYYDASASHGKNSYKRSHRSNYDGYRGNRRDGYRNNSYRHNGYGRARSKVVNRGSYRTKYDAQIYLVEEIYYTRSGREQLVCSVGVKGYERDYVPRRSVRRIANRGCSKYARIQYI